MDMNYNSNSRNAFRDDEATVINNDYIANAASADAAKPIAKKGNSWKQATAGTAAGVLLGSASTLLMGASKADAAETEGEVATDTSNDAGNAATPDWAIGDIEIATGVNDDMTFAEAFAAARQETGSGGAFEWHGNVYATYTRDEWNGMSEQERADFNNHFSWNHEDSAHSDIAHHSPDASHDDTADAMTQNEAGEVEVVDAGNSGNTQAYAEVQVAEAQPAEPDIEILGVVHDPEYNTNVAGMSIDGQGVILIDVDNDLRFDYLAADMNANGQLDEGEVFDIHNGGLTVDDLGGFTNPSDNLCASNDTADFDVTCV